jgi:hypothetical protein
MLIHFGQIDLAESSAGERVVGLVRKIPVTDRHGDEFTLYEFEDRHFLRKVRRLKLETGELVELAPDGSLVIVGRGETLVPVDEAGAP